MVTEKSEKKTDGADTKSAAESADSKSPEAVPAESGAGKKKWQRIGVQVAVGAVVVLAVGLGGLMLFPGGAAHDPSDTAPSRAKFVHPWSESVRCSIPLWSGRRKSVVKAQFTFVYEAPLAAHAAADSHAAAAEGHGSAHGADHGNHGDDDGHAEAGGHLIPAAPVLAAMRRNWGLMERQVVEILLACDRGDLDPKRDRPVLDLRLRNTINRTLFPDYEAEVRQILWR